MGDNDKQIRPIFNSRQGLDFDLEQNLPANLNLGAARRTFNAWESGALTDATGQVWVDEQHLDAIWRTDKATVSFFVGGILPHDRANFSGRRCVKYSAVCYRLNEILQGPITNKRREYLRLSEIIGMHARDASQAEVLRLRNTESVNDAKRRLKADRIRVYGLQFDELTGQLLDIVSCEFHHIRRQSGHSDLIGMIWNGLIVNRSTHNLITSSQISDEIQLHDFCVRMSWSTDWYERYRADVTAHYFGQR
ncbi:TPA: hypothetical protein QDB28_004188 [Burkholderia vietnamiensis]|nr:hypothetical protein [Burkholderia vietnamiensis]